MITPDIAEIRQAVDALSAQIDQAASKRVADVRAACDAARRSLRMLNPAGQLARARERLDGLRARLSRAQSARLGLLGTQLSGLGARLAAIGPQATLARGYAIVRRGRDGALVKSVGDAAPGEALSVRVADGEFGAEAR
jgi:exodeoxyribonuclease VII large subunit